MPCQFVGVIIPACRLASHVDGVLVLRLYKSGARRFLVASVKVDCGGLWKLAGTSEARSEGERLRERERERSSEWGLGAVRHN